MYFFIFMFGVSVFAVGYSSATGFWTGCIVNTLCAAWWTRKIIRESKKSVKADVQISNEAKETLKNLGISITVNEQEII